MDGFGADSLGESLLQWVKSFEDAGGDNSNNSRVDSWGDLTDGHALWAILREVDGDYFAGGLPEPDVGADGDWTRKWQNLKHVDKQNSLYYRDICNGQEQICAGSVPDLKAVAAEGSVRELEKLIMTMIRVAMASPQSNQKMAQRLMGLGRERAMTIANELRSMEEPDYAESSEPVSRDESAYQSEQDVPALEELKANGAAKPAPGIYRDPLLEREEELLQAQATIDKMQANHSAIQRQLAELRQDKDRLQEAFDAYRAEIDTGKGRKGAAGDDAFKKLQKQADSDRSYIDDLETQLQSSRDAIEGYERQMAQFKADSEAAQKLRDDIQMLKAENEDLNQKIKANENLKKKIQTLQEQEKANASLREELKEAKDQLEDLERLQTQQRRLEREILEKQGLIRNQEYQINEMGAMRRNVEASARKLMEELAAARERHDRDHRRIAELEDRYENGATPEVEDEEDRQEESQETKAPERPARPSRDEEATRHWTEKVSMLEKQLEASDARLKQANERLSKHDDAEDKIKEAAGLREKAELQAEEHEKTIGNLRKELEDATKLHKETAPSQDMAILQRENHLMRTAWFDLAHRLQNNGVSLGRRRQEPKSWIGKQRELITPGRGISR